MAIDILNLEPTKISKSLKDKYICIYGVPKIGKTTFAAELPRNLVLGFEHGWNALAGISAVDITKWSEFKIALNQLKKKEAKEKYDTVTIDTIGIAYEACEQYICTQRGVSAINEIPYGQGYSLAKAEFARCLREITQLGYGLLIIAQVDKNIVTVNGKEIETYAPAIPKRAFEIVNQLVDIIGFIDAEYKENGEVDRWLYTRRTPTIMAGSRFKYLPEKISFGYNELVEGINTAIEQEQSKNGALITNEAHIVKSEEYDFSKLKIEAKTLWEKYVGIGDDADIKKAEQLSSKIEKIFGMPTKLSEVSENQVDLLNLAVIELREIVK